MKGFIIRIVLVALQTSLFAVAAGAEASPHFSNGYTCFTCHYTNLFLDIKGVNCLNCHNPGDPYGHGKAFTTADIANPFNTWTGAPAPVRYQSSHNWTGNFTVPGAGALPPENPALTWDCNASTAANEVYCSRCHSIHQPVLPAAELARMKPLLRMANDRDQMCLDCHRQRNTTDHTKGTHPVNVGFTDPDSLAIRKPDEFRNPPLSGNPSNPTATMKLIDGTVLCSTCHGVHHTDGSSETFDSFSSMMTPSDGYLLRSDLRGATSGKLNICTNCHVKPNHDKKGQNIQCADCHAGHVDTADGSIPNVYLIRRFMNISTSHGKVTSSPAFYQYTGSRRNWNSSDPARPGVCQACHAIPLEGYPADHAVKDNAAVCMKCHNHKNTFSHGSGGSGDGCEGCHGHSAGYEYDPGSTSLGRGTWKNHATHTQLDGGNAKGPGVACGACHDTNSFPFFKSGKDSNGDGKFNLAETDVCDICHSPGGAYDGVNDAAYGAKTNWKNSIYNTDNSLKPGMERWCASCHDEEPSVIQGVSAPNVVGDEDGSYVYGSGWGYYKTGHGLPASSYYPASGGVTAGAGVECAGCHNFSSRHIDGNARTFDDGGSSSTKPSAYRQGYRLSLVGGQEPMLVPWPQNVSNTADSYRLCAGCHSPGPYVNSSDTNTNLKTDGINRHAYHLSSNTLSFAADWNGGNTSRMTCVVCHNVHGSTRLAMVRDGKLTGREPGLMIWYNNDAIVYKNTARPDPPDPQNLPLSASTGTLWRGLTSANLCSHCHGNNNTTPEYRTPFQNVAQAPSLTWTGETGYAYDGVSPDNGSESAPFRFRVKYSHANNAAPVVIQVWVDRNDDGDYDEAGERIDLVAVAGQDNNHTDGRIFSATVLLAKAGDNSLRYRFHASDGINEAGGAPTADSSLWLLNEAPQLSWTGESGYLSAGVNPERGGSGASFEFRVKYTDLDNEPPATIQVWVDQNDNGIYEPGEKHSMSSVSPGDNDYGDGKLYSKSLALTRTGDGNLNYRFHAGDGSTDAVGAPTQNMEVIVNTSANTPPTLDWEAGPCRSEGVKPVMGARNADFSFTIRYGDADNRCPSPGAIQVLIDENDNGTYESGEKYNLSEVDPGDTNCADGKLYDLTRPIAFSGDGLLMYRFQASDGSDAATGPATSDAFFTVVDTDYKVRPAGGSGWYGTIQAAINARNSAHTVLVYEGTYNENLTFDNINDHYTTVRSVCGPESTTIKGTTSPVYFMGNKSSLLDGFTITGGTYSGVFINGATPTINNCIIRNNSNNGSGGGGIYITNAASRMTLSNSEIHSNTAANGGGILFNSGSSHIVSNTVIRNNTVTGNGGGMFVQNVGSSSNFTGITVKDNSAGGNGGGMYFNAAAPIINRAEIRGNRAGGNGGGLSLTGSESQLSLTNGIVAGNYAGTTGGGGICSSARPIVLANCTLADNIAGNTGQGGAIYNNSGSVTARNSIFWNNSAGASTLPGHEIFCNGLNLTVENSIFDSSARYFSRTNAALTTSFSNNIASDPLFVGGSPADYHLHSDSPAIDRASAAYAPPNDIDGQVRPHDQPGLNDGIDVYDMGADEYLP